LFTEDQVKSLQINSQSTLSDEELARIGIAQRESEGKPQFIHRTFAEYFVAEFLINQLTKETEKHTNLQDFLLNEVLLQTDCEVIRAFLDGLFGKIRHR
jgi:predicted NACHT family NTPase